MDRTDTPIVSCRGVTKAYVTGNSLTMALRGVDLDVFAGELFMLVGPSGCGKTTLISVMAGILDPDQGSCRLLGRDMKSLEQDALARFRGENIGFVFQNFNLVPSLTVEENVCLPLLIGGVSRREAFEAARARLADVGLEGRGADRPGQLSGGQQQRVAIARALVHDPRLVVCDEPTSALDHATGQGVMEMLKSLSAREGRCLVIVTHDPRIFDYADRFAHMDDGRIERIQAAGAAQGDRS